MTPEPLTRVARRLGVRRQHVAAARLLMERHLAGRLPRAARTSRARVLCYHSVGTPAWGVNDVTPRRFRRHLEAALDAGFRFVPAADVAGGGAGPRDLAITFDDGVASVVTNAWPVLRELGIPWTLFVVTDWAAGGHGLGSDICLGWREIELLAANGASIGSHSITHADFRWLAPEAARWELEESKRIIDKRLGIECTEFAIPFGQSANWSAESQRAALAAGYTHVYAQSVDSRPAGTVARTFVTRYDSDRVFRAALGGAFDRWEEWY